MAVIDGKWLSKEGLTYFWSKIKSIFTKQTETNAIANLGAKNNLFITNRNATFVVNGITFTKNADQTITATGTATANADYPLNSSQSLVIGQKYILSGCPTGGGADNFFLRQLRGAIDYGDGVTFTAESSSANFFIRIRNGHAIQGSLTFKPMLRRAEITDDTFEPYAKTNADLTNENENQQLEIDYAINTGAKNLFNINAVQTANHVTSSLSDGVLTVTSSGNWAHYSVPVNLPAGDYIFTTTISNFSRASGAAATSVRMRIATSTSGGTAPALVTVSGNGPLEIPFTWAGGQLYVQYYPNYSATTTYVSSFTASNSMVRRAEITDTTFQPYAPTNRELYKTRFASKTILPNDVDLNDIKTGGIYNGVNSTGNSASNMPVPNGSFYFNLIVLETNEFIMQIFKKLNMEGDLSFYIRRFYIYNTSWDAWTMVSTDTMRLGKTLASGDNMDNLPVGRFTAPNGTIVAGITNAPWTGTGFFGWTVESIQHGNRFVQFAIQNNDGLNIAKRRYSGTWSAWTYSGNYLYTATGSILDYAASLPIGVYHAAQGVSTGTGKPVSGRRYTYIIHVYSTTLADILAIEGEDQNAGRMYTCLRINSTWGPWFKYEGTQV